MSDDIKRALYYEAANSAGISALISTRFYSAGEAPQNPTLPYATYQVISNVPTHRQGGDAGANFARIQVNCYASDGDGAMAIRDAFKSEFAYFRGTMGAGGSDTAIVKRAFVQDYSDLPTDPSSGAAKGPSGEIMDIEIWYAE